MDWRDFALADPGAAQQSLGAYPTAVREKGEETFRRGVVQAIRCTDPNRGFIGTISANPSIEVGFRFDSVTGRPHPECTCPAGPACEHAYALTRHLLTRHLLVAGNDPKPVIRRGPGKAKLAAAAPSPAAVGSVSGPLPPPPGGPAKPAVPATAAKVSRRSNGAVAAARTTTLTAVSEPSPNRGGPVPEPGPIQRRLLAAGHVPTAEETRFLGQVSELYRRFGRRPSVPRQELERLGLTKATGATSAFDGVQLWRSLPEDEHEFWLYLAQFAEEKGSGIPAFLVPVSPLEALRQKLTLERRRQEVEHWRVELAQWGTPSDPENPEASPTDLRAKLEDGEVLLEWRRGTAEEHEPIKAHQFERFSQTQLGRGLMSTEATLILQAFQQALSASGYKKPALNPSAPAARRALGFLFRQPALASRLVNAEGEPLARPLDPLHWQLSEPEDPNGDYTLSLVQSDGTPPTEILGTFPGEPTLYLTGDAIHKGPPHDERLLGVNRPTTIPAAAVESHGGVRFLRNLGLDLPSRLADRVRLIPLRPVLRLELRQLTFGSDAEHCVLDVLGVSPDALLVERWNGSQWQVPASTAGGMATMATMAAGMPAGPVGLADRIVAIERGALAPVPALVERGGFRWDFARQQWTLRVTRAFPEKFVPWLQSLPPDLPVELHGELASFRNAEVSGQVRLSVEESESIDWFDLRVILDVSDTTLTKEELRLLLDARGRWVRLADKGWRRLEFQLTKDDDEQLARLGLSPHELGAEPQRLHVLQLADDSGSGIVPDDARQRIQERLHELKARVAPPQPASVLATLRPYQLEGFHFLAYLSTNGFGGVLADDMGLGKTLQTLTWLAWLREDTLAKAIAATPEGAVGDPAKPTVLPPSVVVCPKSVCDNWRAESARFTPHLSVRVWGPGEVERMPSELAAADIHILNYNQLRAVGEKLADQPLLCVILDEGQYIKNPGSVTAMIARTLKARHRLVLSGTPIENRLLDLWSLMTFAMPGVLGNRANFQKVFDAKDDPYARRRLTARVRPFLLRRTKTQVARDLPDRIEEDLYCDLEGEQQTLYRAELKRAQQVLLRVRTSKQLNQERFNLLTSLLRLRQICCHPRLVQPTSKAPSAKAEALLELLEPLMEQGQKVLVFSQFVSLLDLLHDELRERGWPVFFLAGETEDRGALVREFQAAEGNCIFLISLKAGGFGLNLTAASYVVLFDPWWNPAVEAQAIDRTHRIGQTQKVIAYRLLIKGSLEEKIRALQHQKRALAGEVLGEENFTSQLALEDFQFLFAD